MWAGISWWFLFARPWWLVMLSIFSRASHLCIFSGEMCVQILCPFLNRVFFVVVVHFLPFCFPPGLRPWLPQREASGRWRQESTPSAGPVCALQLQQPQWHLWPGNWEVSGTLVCVGACLTLKITVGTGCLLFWLEITPVPWFRVFKFS